MRLPHIPVAGRLALFYDEWQNITSDKEILQMVSGLHLPLLHEPSQETVVTYPFSTEENLNIGKEMQKLMCKGVVHEVHHVDGKYLSPIFLTPKSDGSFRMILNLKRFNRCVEYQKFKMDTLNVALTMITPGAYLATIDIQDAYYSVSIFHLHRKFLRFIWNDKVFEYSCMWLLRMDYLQHLDNLLN